jgi:hypothetical protein
MDVQDLKNDSANFLSLIFNLHPSFLPDQNFRKRKLMDHIPTVNNNLEENGMKLIV